MKVFIDTLIKKSTFCLFKYALPLSSAYIGGYSVQKIYNYFYLKPEEFYKNSELSIINWGMVVGFMFGVSFNVIQYPLINIDPKFS